MNIKLLILSEDIFVLIGYTLVFLVLLLQAEEKNNIEWHFPSIEPYNCITVTHCMSTMI